MVIIPLTSKQQQIDTQRTKAVAEYASLWSRVITEWSAASPDDCAWLIYSANYLFRTAGARWALDPLTLKQRVPETGAVDIAKDLGKLSFVLLTHKHKDHLDFDLISTLRHSSIRWVIPEPILSTVIRQTGLTNQSVIIPKALEPIEIEGITITPFDGMHWEKGSPDLDDSFMRGVPAMAYLVEFNGKRWLFPGDIRTYDPRLLPSLGTVDGVFAHLWLGRGCALMAEPPHVELFCRFSIDMKPRRIVVTHLQEFGRAASEYWDSEHYQKVSTRLKEINPVIQVSAAYMGDRVVL